MNCAIYPRELRAAALFASCDKSRYVLNSVYIEGEGDNPPLIVATDGRALVIIKSEAVQAGTRTPCEAGNCIVPVEFLSKALSVLKSSTLPIGIESKERSLTAYLLGLSLTESNNQSNDWTYPKWRRVIPRRKEKRTPIHGIALNPHFVTKIDKLCAALSGEKFGERGIALHFIDRLCAITVTIPRLPNVHVIVMPQQDQLDDMFPEPEWLELPKEEKPAESPQPS